jgi:predicted dinucleotide-binding enzyme
MKIAVLGTGSVGLTLAGRLSELGHEVTIGTRDVAATRARTEPDRFGTPPFSAWVSGYPGVALAAFADAAAAGELVVNATVGIASLAALRTAGRENLAGKVLLDIANPMDPSTGYPPSMFVKDTDSLAEQIQAAFPEAKVVKSLNTMTARLMINPRQLADGGHSVFVSGNDAAAKKSVIGLLESFGHTDIIDLGDLSTARGAEMLLPLWLRLMGVLRTPMFGFKVVR